jgi:hypothetical protein
MHLVTAHPLHPLALKVKIDLTTIIAPFILASSKQVKVNPSSNILTSRTIHNGENWQW